MLESPKNLEKMGDFRNVYGDRSKKQVRLFLNSWVGISLSARKHLPVSALRYPDGRQGPILKAEDTESLRSVNAPSSWDRSVPVDAESPSTLSSHVVGRPSMSSIAFHNGWLGFFRLLTTTLVGGWLGSPMSWSPDSLWLSYSTSPGSEKEDRQAGWLFDTSAKSLNLPERARTGEQNGRTERLPYRVWATYRDAESSVLIEESVWPLSAPAWGPHGRSIAFGRFVPESPEPQQTDPRGRLEVVIQQAPGRKRTVLTIPDYELDPISIAEFPHAMASWSPDGQFLAFPKPGKIPTILVFRVESRKLLQTISQAERPSWSPDGSRLAFIHHDAPEESYLQAFERRGEDLVMARPPINVARTRSAPCWNGDGRSILVVVERPTAGRSELDLTRVFLESGDILRVLPLSVPEPVPSIATFRGVAIDYQREDERCFFAVDSEGRDTEVVWTVPRERSTVKRFHPIDHSLRVGSLAISPDGRSLAMRFGRPSRLTMPAIQDIHDATSDQISLVIPDEAARMAWLAVLNRTARALLVSTLPPALAEGGMARRPTLLPLPGEFPAEHPLLNRLARIGRIGSAACDRPHVQTSTESDAKDLRLGATPEDRLFFNYLRGDYAAASLDFASVEPRVNTPEERLSLLSLHAQILYSRGDTWRAQAMADYLVSAEGRPIYRVDDTPMGPVLTKETAPGQSWARYLSARVNTKARVTRSTVPSATATDRPPDRLPNPFAPFDPLEGKPMRGEIDPFAPGAPEVVPELIRRLVVPPEDRPQQPPIDSRRRRGGE